MEPGKMAKTKKKRRTNKAKTKPKPNIKSRRYDKRSGIVELAVPLTPISASLVDVSGGEEPIIPIGQILKTAFGGVVSELVCKEATRISFSPVFAPVINKSVLVALVEIACHKKDTSDPDSDMECGIQFSIFDKKGEVVDLCDRTTRVSLQGYTRIVITIDRSHLMPLLAIRSALTVRPISGHNVHVVACAIAAMTQERIL